jgi:hypothetical protein
VAHLILLVPDPLLNYLSQGAEVETLKGVQVDPILGVRVMTEEPGHLGELLRRTMIEGGLVRHRQERLPWRRLCQPLIVHRPPDLTHVVLQLQLLLVGVRVGQRDEGRLLPRPLMRRALIHADR